MSGEGERRKLKEIEVCLGVRRSETDTNDEVSCEIGTELKILQQHGKDQSGMRPERRLDSDSNAQERAPEHEFRRNSFPSSVEPAVHPRLRTTEASMDLRAHLARCVLTWPAGESYEEFTSLQSFHYDHFSSRPSSAACRSAPSGRPKRRTFEGTSLRRSGAHTAGGTDPPSVPR